MSQELRMHARQRVQISNRSKMRQIFAADVSCHGLDVSYHGAPVNYLGQKSGSGAYQKLVGNPLGKRVASSRGDTSQTTRINSK